MIFLAKAQDDCEKFKTEKIRRFNLKLAQVTSLFNKEISIKSAGIETSYYLSLDHKNKFGLSLGLGYYYRTLMRNSDFYSHGVGFDSRANYTTTITHQTAEFPLILQYNIFKDKAKQKIITPYIGISLIYLLKGNMNISYQFSDYGIPNFGNNEPTYYNYSYLFGNLNYDKNPNMININNFFPKLNSKITYGLLYPLMRNLSLGIELNYFTRKIGDTFDGENLKKEQNLFTSRYLNSTFLITLKF